MDKFYILVIPYKQMKRKEYLKRIAGISLEILKDKFHKNKIEYSIEKEEGDKKYFRDITLKVKKNLERLFENCSVIPSSGDSTRRFNKEENYIELNAIYNYVVSMNDAEIEIDENYVKITDEYAGRLGIDIGEIPKNQPIDRIRIFQED